MIVKLNDVFLTVLNRQPHVWIDRQWLTVNTCCGKDQWWFWINSKRGPKTFFIFYCLCLSVAENSKMIMDIGCVNLSTWLQQLYHDSFIFLKTVKDSLQLAFFVRKPKYATLSVPESNVGFPLCSSHHQHFKSQVVSPFFHPAAYPPAKSSMACRWWILQHWGPLSSPTESCMTFAELCLIAPRLFQRLSARWAQRACMLNQCLYI